MSDKEREVEPGESSDQSEVLPFELRALGIGEVFDRGIELIARRPLACIGTAIVLLFPALLAQDPLVEWLRSRESSRPFAEMATVLLSHLSTLLTTCVVVLIAGEEWLGRRRTLGERVLVLALALPVVLLTNTLILVLSALGALACLLPGLYLAYRFLFVQLELVLGRPDPLRAIRRSWRLTRSGLFRWLGLLALNVAFALPMSLMAESFHTGSAQEVLKEWAPQLDEAALYWIALAAKCLLLGLPAALNAAAIASLYLDRRVRVEAFDLEWRLRVLQRRNAERERARDRRRADALAERPDASGGLA